MNTIENQKRVNHARSTDAMRALLPALRELSPPERACMLALLAAASDTPVDLVLLGVEGDDAECSFVLDGVLPRGETTTSWKVGSGCEFSVTMLPGEATHE